MKGYKGFNRDMTCRDFQYEQGKTYETERASLCSTGFHFCEKLADCFDYYDKFDSVFHEIEADGDIRTDGKKSVCTRITIGKEVSRIELNRTIYGNGDGNGNGYGYGYGYGDGDGDGNGNGYGYGYGYGDGNGDGNGNGNGNGNGYGYGYGYGNGDGRNIQKILNFKEIAI